MRAKTEFWRRRSKRETETREAFRDRSGRGDQMAAKSTTDRRSWRDRARLDSSCLQCESHLGELPLPANLDLFHATSNGALPSGSAALTMHDAPSSSEELGNSIINCVWAIQLPVDNAKLKELALARRLTLASSGIVSRLACFRGWHTNPSSFSAVENTYMTGMSESPKLTIRSKALLSPRLSVNGYEYRQ
jgi:hypothetical protein